MTHWTAPHQVQHIVQAKQPMLGQTVEGVQCKQIHCACNINVATTYISKSVTSAMSVYCGE